MREADVEGGGQGMPGIQQQKKRKRKLPTPPSPPFCPAAPCNTPTVRREKNKKHNKERKGKKKVVRFAKIQERTKEESTDKLHISSGRKPWSADVEVTPLEFSEQNYKRNFVTASLFAGTIHMGYSGEEEGRREWRKKGNSLVLGESYLRVIWNSDDDSGSLITEFFQTSVN